MRKAFTKIVIFTILIGVIGFTINLIFPNSVTYITTVKYNGITMYKYDFWNYVDNIRNSFTNVAQLTMTFPEREFINTPVDLTDQAFWEAMLNNMAYLLNTIIIGLNVLLYPIRIAFYAIQALLAIIGIPVMQPEGTGLQWLVELCKFMTTLAINYV